MLHEAQYTLEHHSVKKCVVIQKPLLGRFLYYDTELRILLNDQVPLLTNLAVIVLAAVVLEGANLVSNKLYDHWLIERSFFRDIELIEHKVVRTCGVGNRNFYRVPLLHLYLFE